ncbi:hypothetical protein [Streptomyces yangpuensis]|uniref:hypothetical protein n=1 Tax=Streptomyces yangpuensis TaxID=1648182 RepID=UPI0038063247
MPSASTPDSEPEPPNPDDWPAAPPNVTPEEAGKALYDAKLTSYQAMLQHGRNRVEASHTADLANEQRFHESLLKLSETSIDRAHAGADAVQKSAAAIATIYAAILGVSFSVAAKPLPWIGVLAPLFLGIAIFLSTAYRAYIAKGLGEISAPKRTQVFKTDALNRTNAFTSLMKKLVLAKASLLRASVIALAVGILYIPAPFVSFPGVEGAADNRNKQEWPNEPKADVNKEYGAILFKAQVDEASRVRAQPQLGDSLWWTVGLAAGGLLLVTLVAIQKNPSAA